MKKYKSKRAVIALALATVPLLMGCGSSGGSTSGQGSAGFGSGSCVPIASQIPFTGTNAQFTPMSIRAGRIPGGQTYGQTGMGGGTVPRKIRPKNPNWRLR